MTFESLNLNGVYSSEHDDLVKTFYNPVLSEAKKYQRITGYFSSNSFALAYEGLSNFIRNGGKMQFILNVQLSQEDYEQIKLGQTEPESIISKMFINDLDNLEDECIKNHASVLGWLVASGRLDLKIGYMRDGSTTPILHQKLGILVDSEDNKIVFTGSINETAGGWIYNSESFSVFCDWTSDEDILMNYIILYQREFDTLWANESKKTAVISFPEAAKNKLISLAPYNDKYVFDYLDGCGKYNLKDDKVDYQKEKEKPEKKEIKIRGYQIDAIQSWINNKYNGLFEMATGTGKTITAIGALSKIMEIENRLITIVICPFLHLCSQWESAIKNMHPELNIIQASGLNKKWEAEFDKFALNIVLKPGNLVVITTTDTASSENFLNIINKFTTKYPLKFMLIGDEVHTIGSIDTRKALCPEYSYRIGLSATPKRYFDEEGTEALIEYFDKTVFVFTLSEAINNINPDTNETYLCPYDYHLKITKLIQSEEEEFMAKTRIISAIYSKKNNHTDTKKDLINLEKLLRDRQDIVKNAVNKYALFKELIIELLEKDELHHTLVYCSPEQIEHVNEILDEVGRKTGKFISVHRFTSKEDATKKGYDGLTERGRILSKFDKDDYHVLVAIKCLDEGVDVPSTQRAILMCSSGNHKEYIQRRGRILRRYPNKEKAILYDFVALPDIISDLSISMIYKIIDDQKKRLAEFAKDSLNKPDIDTIIQNFYQSNELFVEKG